MSACFVRGLFGDELVDGYPGLLGDLASRSRDALKPEPCLWFAWGTENATAIRKAGFEPTLLSDEPIPRKGFSGEPDYITGFGVQPFGWNIYRLKFDAIRAALMAGYTSVLWLDMDVEQVLPLPADFWQVLHDRQPLQAPLVQYHKVQAPWRSVCRRTSIYCATSYWRGGNVVERCLEYANQHPRAFEQAAMNREIDRLAGGFPGVDGYRDKGFEFPFTERKGGMIFPPREPVFRIHSKGWSQFKSDKVNGAKRWREHVDDVLAKRDWVAVKAITQKTYDKYTNGGLN